MKFTLLSVVFALCLVQHSSCIALFDNLFGRHRSSGYSEEQSEKDGTAFDCGRNKMPPRIAYAIVGGMAVKDQQTAPYIAAIGGKLGNNSAVTWYCGGALISSNVVVTAAHCLASKRPDVVRLGGTNLESHSLTQHIPVESFKIHPKYRFPQSYHDIAVIILATSVRPSKRVRPICLIEENRRSISEQQAYVMGWGADSAGGGRSEELQQVKVKIFENRDCDRAYSNSSIAPINFPQGITDEQLCAGSDRGGKDACQGDSGGPLVMTDSRGVTILVGVVSSGAGCGFKAYPGVYVRVSSYNQWLNQFL